MSSAAPPPRAQAGDHAAAKGVKLGFSNITYWSKKVRRGFASSFGRFDIIVGAEHRLADPRTLVEFYHRKNYQVRASAAAVTEAGSTSGGTRAGTTRRRRT